MRTCDAQTVIEAIGEARAEVESTDHLQATVALLSHSAGDQELQDRLLRVKPVLGLFENDALRVDGYRTWRTRRRNNVELSTLDFEGVLAVNDQRRFLDAILLGIGPAKAFGCGLMLVRRL